ncbi:hypothetical protein GCK32_016002 [Trichostrongylus colubriformis]|uniref:Uncharacterized protein n=1 Tax=Trichostrongylus colubriformis TaxID=6319 RepID=A0AAN8GAI6_TRICO
MRKVFLQLLIASTIGIRWINASDTEDIEDMDDVREKRDISKKKLFGEKGKGLFERYATVSIVIRDAVCYSAPSKSQFTVHLLALDFEDRFLSALRINGRNFTYDKSISSYTYRRKVLYKHRSGLGLLQCFHEGYVDCAPRADAVMIRFEAVPDDPWAIDHIDVQVYFQAGYAGKTWQIWHFEHSVLKPCNAWLDSRATYQFGPRNGLFIKHDYWYFPGPFERIRDWV